jgi:hypothetical protein
MCFSNYLHLMLYLTEVTVFEFSLYDVGGHLHVPRVVTPGGKMWVASTGLGALKKKGVCVSSVIETRVSDCLGKCMTAPDHTLVCTEWRQLLQRGGLLSLVIHTVLTSVLVDPRRMHSENATQLGPLYCKNSVGQSPQDGSKPSNRSYVMSWEEPFTAACIHSFLICLHTCLLT